MGLHEKPDHPHWFGVSLRIASIPCRRPSDVGWSGYFRARIGGSLAIAFNPQKLFNWNRREFIVPGARLSIDIGYVVGLDKTEVTIADALVYGKVVSKFKMADVVNGTDQALSVGDKILYRRMGQNDRNLVVQSILGHHVPTAPNMETFLSRLRYAADDLGEASDQFREVMEQAINGRFVIVGHDHAEIVTKLTEDVGTRQCPNLLSTDADLSSGFPVVIEVPDVSGNTLTYLHRIAKPSDTDKVLRIRLISYRFLHLLFHATGYHEHMPDFGLLARNLEAGDREIHRSLRKKYLA